MAASAFAIGLEAVVKACAGVPGAVVPNPAIPLPTLLLWGIGLACAPHVFSHRLSRKGAWLVSVLAAFQFCVHSWQSHRHPEITLVFLAVGHGDAALLRVPGADFLIDAGPSHGIARQRLIPALRALGVHSLKGALITHGDADHVAGLSGLLGQVRIASLGISKGMDGSRPFNRCLERAEAMGIPLQNLEEGDVLYRGPSGQLQVIAPGHPQSDFDRNDRSLVLLWEGVGGSWVFTGDLERPGQAAIRRYRPLLAGMHFKMPHHGSDRTTDPDFIREFRPRSAVISSGQRPGFPGRQVMHLLDSLEIPVHVTKTQGSLTWRSTLSHL
jgi:competence protein ComEC